MYTNMVFCPNDLIKEYVLSENGQQAPSSSIKMSVLLISSFLVSDVSESLISLK